MNSNFHLLFYIRKQKTTKGVQCPSTCALPLMVNVRICPLAGIATRSNGTVIQGVPLEPKKKLRRLTIIWTALQTKLRNAHQVLIDANQQVTTESLQNQFTGKTQKSRFLMQLFKEHNTKVKALIGNGFEANTLKGYNTSEKHLTGYLLNEYGKTDIEISQLDYAFITGFEFYLKAECKISGVSAAKYIKHLKKIVNHCISNNWLKQNPFINFKSSAKAKERTYLTQQELDAITNKKFIVERLTQVRDVFVFCCYTGLSYADVKKLRRNEIGIGMDGDRWIFTSRQKTDTSSRIPLLPVALEILNSYQDHPQCENQGLLLPVLSNQKMNAYLKEIADLSDVFKHLTFHLARHTFATTVTLSNNVPIETVSKMLGHTNIKTTQHYAKILDLKVSQDMAALKQKYAGI
jgi:site-specific recombinase XerD